LSVIVPETTFSIKKRTFYRRLVMEDLHKIHKDVPYGYWVLWVEPAFKALVRKWRARQQPAAPRPA
jgi:hypothetical protein